MSPHERNLFAAMFQGMRCAVTETLSLARDGLPGPRPEDAADCAAVNVPASHPRCRKAWELGYASCCGLGSLPSSVLAFELPSWSIPEVQS